MYFARKVVCVFIILSEFFPPSIIPLNQLAFCKLRFIVKTLNKSQFGLYILLAGLSKDIYLTSWNLGGR